MAETDVLKSLVSKTDDGLLKWYEDNDAQGKWYRCEITGYNVSLRRGRGRLIIAHGGKTVQTIDNAEELEAMIVSHLDTVAAEKAADFAVVLEDI
jgi:hypothetical protein